MNNQTPYFLFSPKILEENYKEFENLCKKYIKNYIIAYSVKTNSFSGVLQKLSKLDSNFEVASLEEINKAAEFSAKSFVFNGPCKTQEELKIAIEKKFLINVDSYSEIDRISDLLQGKKLNISLRISLKESKFGFFVDKLEETINYCKQKKLNVIGLHFHNSTQNNLEDYQDYINKIKTVLETKNTSIKYLDIGGGFPDKYHLKNRGLKLEDYFKIIDKLKKFNLKIILEPGRCLVADSFDLITKVCIIKENSGKNYAILDVGINVLSKITLSKYFFDKINSFKPLTKKNYTLAGPLLFNNDIVGRYQGLLKEGDLIKVSNVGAYCYNLAWEISYKKPKVLIQ